jgi:hypothetical protein
MVVERDQLLHVLNHLDQCTAEDARQLAHLAETYSYCQVFLTAAARASKQHRLPEEQNLLTRAAVLSTDRHVLKVIMTNASATPAVTTAGTSSTETGIDVADQVVHDLERLQELKHNFELLVSTGSLPKPIKPKKNTPSRTLKPGQSKKQRIVELARQLDTPARKHELDPLIDSIASSKKRVAPESETTREQIEIIDQFIKAKPSISPPQAVPDAPPADLSSSIKSGEFGENIVSETLVEILLRQGKKDKAIEVLKKLIWKFPQKKTYFAARIEDLKK